MDRVRREGKRKREGVEVSRFDMAEQIMSFGDGFSWCYNAKI